MNQVINKIFMRKKMKLSAEEVCFDDEFLENIFDANSYLQFNEDVRNANVDAKKHFLNYGVFEGRSLKTYTGSLSRVLFVDGIGNATTVYRVYNLVNALRFNGVETNIVSTPFIIDQKQIVNDYDLVVFVRVAWDEKIKEVVKFCKSMKIPVVVDFDDYVFEPKIVSKDNIDGIKHFNEEMMCDYMDGVLRYRQMMQMADFVTVSTDFLREKVNALGFKVFHISNSLETNYYGSALGWKGLHKTISKKKVSKEKSIVYLSGSNTHQKDFHQSVGAIVKIMEQDDSVVLKIYGSLNLLDFPELGGLSERVSEFPLVPFSEYFSQLPGIFIDAYLAIAPLDLESEFCHAKSELKFFEASAFGVPVIASNTISYNNAIKHGVDGFLCETEAEWYEAIKLLLDDVDIYEKIALSSRKKSLTRYGPFRIAADALSVYEEIAFKKDAVSITWLVPGPIPPESGGHNSILMAAKEMVNRGFDVRMYLTCDKVGVEESYEAIRYKFGSYEGIKLFPGIDNIKTSNVVIATHYTTALSLRNRLDVADLIYYFVQDYEPYFNAIGTAFFQAEYTYKLGFKHITIGSWLKGMIKQHSDDAKHIDFWIDRPKYYVDEDIAKNGKVVTFFARPSMPRRCYDLGLEALSKISKAIPDVEINFYGEPNFPADGIDFEFNSLGVLNKDELRDLYNRSAVVMAFSTTNPSIATFEIMACGTAVVDLDVFDARERHFGYPALLCDPIDDDVAAKVISLLSDQEKLRELSLKSKEFADSMPEPQESVAIMADYIQEDIMNELSNELSNESVGE